ncbi:MAG: tetratricopeptide repeat protein [Myxococcota bacterium]
MPKPTSHLSPERAGALAAGENPDAFEAVHLAECSACRTSLARARSCLGLLWTGDMDELAARRVENALLSQAAAPAAEEQRRGVRAPAAAAAALLLVLVGLGAVLARSRAPREPQPVPSQPRALRAVASAPSLQCVEPPASELAQAWAVFEAQPLATPASRPPGPAGADRARPAPAALARSVRRPRQSVLAERSSVTAPTSTIAWGETTVTRHPPADPFSALLLKGLEAYAAGRHSEADQLAKEALGTAKNSAQRLSAWSLACDTRIADRRPAAAVEACQELLSHPNPERVRTTHFLLGTLHRAHLDDCERAMEHYGRALVFGVPSLYTQEALRFRAECALQLGRLDEAEADLGRLRAQPGLISRWSELEALELKLRQAQEAALPTAPVR